MKTIRGLKKKENIIVLLIKKVVELYRRKYCIINWEFDMKVAESLIKKIEILFGDSKYQEAIAFIDSSLNRSAMNSSIMKALYYQRGRCYQAMGKFKEALDSFIISLDVPTAKRDEDFIKGKIEAAIGETYYDLSNYDKAFDYLSSAFEILRDTAENFEIASIQRHLGWYYLKVGSIKKAKSFLEDSISSYRRLGQHQEVAGVKNDLAHIFFINGQWKNALEQLEDSVEIKISSKTYKGLSSHYTNIGTLNMFLGNYEKSLHYFRKSEKMANRIEPERNYNLVHNNIQTGKLYINMHLFDKSLKYVNKGLNLAIEKGMKREIAIGHEYLGELAFEQCDYERAEMCYEEAREIAEAIAPEGDLINELYRRIGDLKVRTGDLKGAWKATERALEVSRNLGDRYEESLTYRVRGLVLKERGKKEEALMHFERCLKTLTSIGEKYEAARTHLEIGILLGESKDSEEDLQQASYHLRNAMDLFDDLGIDFYKANVAVEMAKVHVAEGEDDMVISRLKYAEDIVKGTEDEDELAVRVREIGHSLEESIVERVIASRRDGSLLTGSNVSSLGFPYNMEGLEKILLHVMDRVNAERGFIASLAGSRKEYMVSVTRGLGVLRGGRLPTHCTALE